MNKQSSWYFSAAWEPIPIRRGDALGLREGADYFAELLAPGLSNSTFDARWISLLSWCLTWSHVVWRTAGGVDLAQREDQRARYAWLRPLELLWIARTLASKQTTGQLRGRRSVKRWRDAVKGGQPPPSNFAMSPDQFRRYRQVGMYGAYRVVFRRVPGLTTGDGWTPGDTALKLAALVNDSLPRAAKLRPEQFKNGTKWGHWRGGGEARYWVKSGWRASLETQGGLLPTSDDAVRQQLPEEERRLLEPALFGSDSVRRVTAQALASAKGARSHADLCEALANSSALSKKIEPASLASLPAFSRLADAAMHAMRGLWNEINHDEEKQAPTVAKLAISADLQLRFEQLGNASVAWLSAPGRSDFRYEEVVTLLAEAMRDSATPIEQLRALVKHHHEHGGGRRWFREQAGTLVPLVADTGVAASDYRFRLRSICLLAAQCGVANMNKALDVVTQYGPDDEEGDLP